MNISCVYPVYIPYLLGTAYIRLIYGTYTGYIRDIPDPEPYFAEAGTCIM